MKKQCIGIDVSSKKLNIHIPDEGDYEIPNTEEQIKKFKEEHRLSPKSHVVGVESTGRYHLLCERVFVQEGYEFRVLNPILTGRKIASSIRKKKTDISDARLITRLVEQGEGNVITNKQIDRTKRTILRTRKRVVEQKSAIKKLIQSLELAGEDPRIERVKNALNGLIEGMEICVEQLEKEGLGGTPTEEELLIRSIPGFATRLAGIIASETGDFSRFPSATQFKAYVGIDPKVTQSGGMLKTGKITKRGNSYMRHAFYLAANVARIHDPELKSFFEKKRKEGKAYRVAVCAVARKLCERVYAVVTKRTPYEIRQPFFS